MPLASSYQHKVVVAFEARNGYTTDVALAYPRFFSFDTAPQYINVIIRDPSGALDSRSSQEPGVCDMKVQIMPLDDPPSSPRSDR